MRNNLLSYWTLHGAVLTLTLVVSRSGCGQGLDFGYHDNQQLENFLKNISLSYPAITRLYSIGKSVRGADLWVIAIGESPESHVLLRPNVKYVANIHGNEIVGREDLLHFVEYLVTNYGRLQNVTYLLNTSTVHILPSLNPDGYATATTAPDCDDNHGRANANSYDLNRNFPDFFVPNTNPMQPETRAIMNWIHNTQFVLSANLHGGALVANYPFDNFLGADPKGSAEANPCPDEDVFVHLSKTYSLTHPTMAKPLACPEYNFTDGITNGAEWYALTGGMQDFNYIYAGCYEITLELSCCKFPPAESLRAFWDADRDPLLAYLMQVNIGVKGMVKDKNNNSVEGAQVTVQGREMVHSTTTRQGEYWRLLLPGYYRLLVSTGSCSPKVVPFEVQQGSVTLLNVTLDTTNITCTNVAGSSSRFVTTQPFGVLLFCLVAFVTFSRAG